jgi:hypothetical protein
MHAMNWIHRTAFAVALTSCIIFAKAADAPTTMPAVDQATAALIDQLDSDDYHTRQSASDQLTARGETIRPAMAALAVLGKSPEVQTAAAAVVAALDKAAADRPTMITLHMKEANPREVFAEIARQSHADLPIWPSQLWADARMGPIPKVTLDMDQQPFWLALAQACQATSTHIQNMGMNQGITIAQGASGGMLAGPLSTNGLFIVVADSASRNRQVSYITGRVFSNNDAIQFQLYADPKAHLMDAENQAVLTLATDDKGNSLIAPNNNVARYRVTQQGMPITFSAPLHFPSDGYTKATKLKGTLGVRVAAKTSTLEIADVSAALNTTRIVGPWSVQLQDFHIDGANGSLKVKIQTGGTQAGDVFTAARTIRLTDAAGQFLNGGGGGSGSNLEIDYQCNFNASEKIKSPVKLTWDVVTESKIQDVPFEFTDLPLPAP